MPSLAEMLMGYLPSGASPVFGTTTPQEQAMVPPTGLDQAVGGAINSMATLPQRAIQNSQFSLGTGTYDPSTSIESAMMTMGASPFGSGIEGTSPVFGAGPIKAYHGSPHDFDKFDLSKIGTGEGAQAYGHGLYFAENEGTAKSYRDALSGWKIGEQPVDPANPSHIAAATLEHHNGDMDRAIKDLVNTAASGPMDERQAANHAIQLLRNPENSLPDVRRSGHMYEVNINADPAHFLDWDKPLSQQHPEVAKALDQVVKSRDRLPAEWINSSPGAEQRMSEAGIPGIKYLDQGSRATSGGHLVSVEKTADGWQAKIKVDDRGGVAFQGPSQMFTTSKPYATEAEARQWADSKINSGSRNYVLFNDKLIDILRKYGLAGASATGAMSPVYGPQQPNLTAQALMEGS